MATSSVDVTRPAGPADLALPLTLVQDLALADTARTADSAARTASPPAGAPAAAPTRKNRGAARRRTAVRG